jgi:beta-lactamase regulating signal transducer with metallopeptidase domain
LVGVIDPVLLVPKHFFHSFDENDIGAILRHELAHVSRRDTFFNFLQKIVLSLFWFHPLVHCMDTMIMRAREEIYDNYVLAQVSAADYGEVLLRLNVNHPLSASTKNSLIHLRLVMGVVAGDWNLEQRISDLLNQKRKKIMQLSKQCRILLNASVLATVFTVAACQVTAQDAVSTSSQSDGTVQTQSAASANDQMLSPEVVVAITEIQGLMTGREDAGGCQGRPR